MSDRTEDKIGALKRGFSVTETADGYTIACKGCTAAWSLKAAPGGEIKVGNILHLLNHEAGHSKRTR